MKTLLKLLTLSAASGLMTVGAVLAQTPPPAAFGPPPFAAVDQNGDGAITPDELSAFHAARMAERSQLGYPMRNAGAGPNFAAFDTNADGVLTAEEFPPMRGRAAGPYGRGYRGGPPGRGWGGRGPGPCWQQAPQVAPPAAS